MGDEANFYLQKSDLIKDQHSNVIEQTKKISQGFGDMRRDFFAIKHVARLVDA